MVALPNHTADGAVWFAKNSDREPGEAQAVDHLPQIHHHNARTLQCTYIEIPQTAHTNAVILSRPFWMWGAEIGANHHGVAIGNEAVWTKLPVAKSGLTGMDLLRLALERTASAREALEFITTFLQRYGQGGNCGYRHKNFRYHNSFIIADPHEAWVLETADTMWAAEKVRGIRSISNALSIGKEFDLIADEAYRLARRQGWCKASADFDFARCFGDAKYRKLSGALERSACTLKNLKQKNDKLEREDFFAALRDHNGLQPQDGWRMKMPCAHASWWPTRIAGQTTGAMVSRLHSTDQTHWLTGTSSPCLSIFKPLVLESDLIVTGATPGVGYDAESLFWRHEKLHRLVLRDYEVLKKIIDDTRMALEAGFVSSVETWRTASQCRKAWETHRQILPEWLRQVEQAAPLVGQLSRFKRFWVKQEKLDSKGRAN